MPPALKIVLLGDSSVGKSSLVNRFTIDTFDPNSANTIGAAFISKEHTFKNRTVKFEIWDTAGQERYKSLTPMYYRNAKVALVCFDLSCAEQSFEKAKYWINQLSISGPHDILVQVVGTKQDLVEGIADADLPLVSIREYCSDRELTLVKTSAKSGAGVREIFDSIVENLDESVFEQVANDESDVVSDNIILRIGPSMRSCC